MKNKKIIIGISCLVVCVCIIAGVSVRAARKENKSFGELWGSYLAQKHSGEEIYAKGKDVNVTVEDYEQTCQFYLLAGELEKDAQSKALEYCEERSALYHAALQARYEVTDKEIRDYLDRLKTMIEGSEGEDMYRQVMENFESEEDYWDYQYMVYEMNLPIEKYVAAQKEVYFSQNGYASGDMEGETEWTEALETLKDELRLKQEFQVVVSEP